MSNSSEFVESPLILPNTIVEREYQSQIFQGCVDKSCLVSLPTGLGKTVIFLRLASKKLFEMKGSFILLLAPTRPLVQQHFNTLQETLDIPADDILQISGEVKQEERSSKYKSSKIIVATPQTIKNDLIHQRLSLENCSLICFDEAHRAAGEYPYSFVADVYVRQNKAPHLLAITASPAKNEERLEELLKTLHLEQYIFRDETSEDVLPYVQDIQEKRIFIQLTPELEKVATLIHHIYKDLLTKLKKSKVIKSSSPRKIKRTDLLKAMNNLEKIYKGGKESLTDYYICKGLLGNCIRLSHCIELLETQGPIILSHYLDKLLKEVSSKKASKTLTNLVQSELFQQVRYEVKNLELLGVEHPKLIYAVKEIEKTLITSDQSRVLIFVNFRKTATFLSKKLSENEIIKAHPFIGQATRGKERGISQKQQVALLEKFKTGEYNTLIATSVAEEGLDIAQCDLVLFYDTVPSAIRAIQRRGRTGRKRAGKVVYLITKGTVDEGYFWANRVQERKMREVWQNREKKQKRGRPTKYQKTLLQSKQSANGSSSSGIVSQTSLPKKEEVLEADVLDDILSSVTPEHEQHGKNSESKDFGQLSSYSPDTKGVEKRTQLEKSIKMKVTEESVNSVRKTKQTEGDFVSIRVRAGISSDFLTILSRECKTIVDNGLSADFVVTENVGIVRMLLHDFAQKKIDKTLVQYIIELMNSYAKLIIVVEGKTNERITSIVLNKIIASVLASISVAIIRTNDREDSVEIIKGIAERCQKEKRSTSIRQLKSDSVKEQQLFFISGLPGIGRKEAELLLAHFYSPYNVANADIQGLKEVKRIGEKKATRIYEVMTGENLHSKERNQVNLNVDPKEVIEGENSSEIIIDHRENVGKLISRLLEHTKIDIKRLDVGDYLVKKRFAIERKTGVDFAKSIIDKRLFGQIYSTRKVFHNTILVIEDMEKMYNGNLHPKAIRNAIASILVDFSIPVVYTKDSEETADFILTLKDLARGDPLDYEAIAIKASSIKIEQEQRYLVGGLPGIDSERTKLLLQHIGSPKGIANADVNDLLKIKGIGEKLAHTVYEILKEDIHFENMTDN